MHTTWSSHPGAWHTPWHLPDWLLQWKCAPQSTHMADGQSTLFFFSPFFLALSSLSLLPSFFSFFQDSNQQNKSSNIFHSAPGVVLNQQGKLTQWTRLLPPGPSLCLCDPGPVTFDHGAYWALLLSSDPFTPTPPPSSLLGGQKQASLQNTSNSKGQNLSPPLSHRTWSSYSALICILHAIFLVTREEVRNPTGCLLCVTHTHTHTHTALTHPSLQMTNHQVLSAFPVEIVMPY